MLTHAHIHTHTYIHTYTYTHIHTAYMHTHTYIHHTHIHTYIHTTHTYTHTQLSLFFDILQCLTTSTTQEDYIAGKYRSSTQQSSETPPAIMERARSLLWKHLRGTKLRSGGLLIEQPYGHEAKVRCFLMETP